MTLDDQQHSCSEKLAEVLIQQTKITDRLSNLTAQLELVVEKQNMIIEYGIRDRKLMIRAGIVCFTLIMLKETGPWFVKLTTLI